MSLIVLYMERFQNVVLESMVLTVRILAKVVYVKHVISGMGHVQTKVAVNLDGNPGCPCVIQVTGIYFSYISYY
jgi:hypothetical protein